MHKNSAKKYASAKNITVRMSNIEHKNIATLRLIGNNNYSTPHTDLDKFYI